MHPAYFEAGADAATTATYQSSRPGLTRAGLSDEAAAGTESLRDFHAPRLELLASAAPDLEVLAGSTAVVAAGVKCSALAATWVEAGARLIGGCCRVGPADIARLAASVGSWK